MNVEYINGDVFAPPRPGENIAIAHGVNCRGAFGAGVAGLIRTRWHGAYEAYLDNFSTLHLGEVIAWTDTSGRVTIYHLATQLQPGPHASVSAISDALRKACTICHDAGFTVLRMPWIGCGIGGLERRHVRPAIERVAAQSSVRIRVYDLKGTMR